MRKTAIAAMLAALIACRSHPPQPVEIEPSDMCANCRMAISQKRFAAEILDRDENPVKFDDVSCLLRYLSDPARRAQAAAIFVVDYETREWLPAREAHFVSVPGMETPMGGGMAAFRNPARAAAFALERSGKIVELAQLK